MTISIERDLLQRFDRIVKRKRRLEKGAEVDRTSLVTDLVALYCWYTEAGREMPELGEKGH